MEYRTSGADDFVEDKDDIDGQSASYTLESLTVGTNYDIRVTAVKYGIESDSASVTAATSEF